jgi:predicted nucleic acid-binding Zn ribbon protein
MSSTALAATEQQRRRVRRSALLWALIAATFYVGFIVMALLRGVK